MVTDECRGKHDVVIDTYQHDKMPVLAPENGGETADIDMKQRNFMSLLLLLLPYFLTIIFIHQQLVATQQIKHNNNINNFGNLYIAPQ